MRNLPKPAAVIMSFCLYLCVGHVAVLAGYAAPLTTAQIAARVLPSVVSITVLGKDGQILKTGSGFVVSQGIVATNQHVVSGAHAVTINFASGHSVSSPGFIVERTRFDLALIACDTGNAPSLPLADTSAVNIGEDVVAIGSPEGLTGSVATGIVSGIRNMPARRNEKVFQTT